MNAGDDTHDAAVLVIGGGPAGYTAAIRAAQLDCDVTLVERDAYGGACLNHGCIPSKALISATDVAYEAATAEAMGIDADPAVDLSRMIAWKDGIVDQLASGVEKLCKANQVTLVDGEARFIDDHTVEISGATETTLSFEHAIIATGSRPIEIPNFSYADEPILSSREALALESIPDSLVIVGGGYIGMELAGVFAKLGTEVTVVEMESDVLPRYDDDLSKPVRRRAKRLGIDVVVEHTATAWEPREEGDGIVVTAAPVPGVSGPDGTGSESNPATDTAETTQADELTLDTDAVLVAVGREPVSDALGLEAAGVDTDERGFVVTDDATRTSAEHVFAVGDVAGEPMLAHAGAAEGKVAADVIAGGAGSVDVGTIPAVVFTEPEIATVGLTPTAAEDEGTDVVVGEFPFRASGRALTTGQTDGFVRIVAAGDTGTVLGGQVVGPDASELVAELGLAVDLGATLHDVAHTVHAHPTLSEAVMEAAENALGRAIHTLNR